MINNEIVKAPINNLQLKTIKHLYNNVVELINSYILMKTIINDKEHIELRYKLNELECKGKIAYHNRLINYFEINFYNNCCIVEIILFDESNEKIEIFKQFLDKYCGNCIFDQSSTLKMVITTKSRNSELIVSELLRIL